MEFVPAPHVRSAKALERIADSLERIVRCLEEDKNR